MTEWKKATLDEMGVVSRGRSKHRPRNDAKLFGGKYPFIQTGDIGAAGLYVVEYSQTYNEEGLAQSKLWEKDTLCITIAANIADTALLAFPACFPDSIMGFIPFENVSNVKFVKYCFDILKKDCQQISQGTAQDNLSWKKLSTILFPCPQIYVQNRIADILSRYDSLIENYQRQIKLLEEAAQRLYKEWFVVLRFPGHETTPIINDIPDGWQKKKLADVVDLRSGYAFKSSTFVDKGRYKLVTIKNVKDGFFDGDNVSYLESIPEKMPLHCVLNTGDILLSLTGNVGRVCMVTGNDYLLNQRVAKLKSSIPAFAYCLFRSHDMFIAINNLANGAAQQNVSPIKIGELNVVVADDETINKFELLCGKIINRILKLHTQICHLSEARDRLLPKLMNGEIIKIFD